MSKDKSTSNAELRDKIITLIGKIEFFEAAGVVEGVVNVNKEKGTIKIKLPSGFYTLNGGIDNMEIIEPNGKTFDAHKSENNEFLQNLTNIFLQYLESKEAQSAKDKKSTQNSDKLESEKPSIDISILKMEQNYKERLAEVKPLTKSFLRKVNEISKTLDRDKSYVFNFMGDDKKQYDGKIEFLDECCVIQIPTSPFLESIIDLLPDNEVIKLIQKEDSWQIPLEVIKYQEFASILRGVHESLLQITAPKTRKQEDLAIADNATDADADLARAIALSLSDNVLDEDADLAAAIALSLSGKETESVNGKNPETKLKTQDYQTLQNRFLDQEKF